MYFFIAGITGNSDQFDYFNKYYLKLKEPEHVTLGNRFFNHCNHCCHFRI